MMLKTVLKQFVLVKMKTNPLKKCSETKRSHFWYTSLLEALFDQDKWRDQLSDDKVAKRLRLIVVDEAHTVYSW